MKAVIFTLCALVSSVAAQTIDSNINVSGKKSTQGSGPKGPPIGLPPNIPGCANPPKGTKLSDCCTNFPKFFSKEVMNNNCSANCMKNLKSRNCCLSECSLDKFDVTVNGKFDATKGKAAIAKMAATNTAFTTDLIVKIVDDCISTAPNKLQDWRSKAPADMAPNCSSDNSLNMVISGCIRRELFFQCPGMKTTKNCKELVGFGQGCAFFPFHDTSIGWGFRRPDGEDGDKCQTTGSSSIGSKPMNGTETSRTAKTAENSTGTTRTAQKKPTSKPNITKAAGSKKTMGVTVKA